MATSTTAVALVFASRPSPSSAVRLRSFQPLDSTVRSVFSPLRRPVFSATDCSRDCPPRDCSHGLLPLTVRATVDHLQRDCSPLSTVRAIVCLHATSIVCFCATSGSSGTSSSQRSCSLRVAVCLRTTLAVCFCATSGSSGTSS